MKKIIISTGFALSGLLGAANATAVEMTTIDILCTESEMCGSYTGSTNDGSIFTANANPTEPATGTGVFQPFVRIQELGNGDSLQNGYNTDGGEPDINFDTKASIWTHSVLFGDLGTVDIDGINYFEFQLDANETGSADSMENQILITDIQIYIGDNPDMANPEDGSGYTGTPYDSSDNSLLGESPIWSLDNIVNGNVDVLLQASICDTPGQCGSGHGDMSFFIPETYLTGNDDDYFVFYTEYADADSGFEEWRYLSGGHTTQIPEPTSFALLLAGLIGARAAKKRNV